MFATQFKCFRTKFNVLDMLRFSPILFERIKICKAIIFHICCEHCGFNRNNKNEKKYQSIECAKFLFPNLLPHTFMSLTILSGNQICSQRCRFTVVYCKGYDRNVQTISRYISNPFNAATNEWTAKNRFASKIRLMYPIHLRVFPQRN